MKREIIFKGKSENGVWVYGDLIQSYENANYWLIMQGNVSVRVIPESVGQYIGLKDSLGNKIFEGDIIQYGENEEYDLFFAKGVVEFGEGTFDSGIYKYTGFYYRDKNGKIDHNALYKIENSWEDKFVVIGNVFDNKEF